MKLIDTLSKCQYSRVTMGNRWLTGGYPRFTVLEAVEGEDQGKEIISTSSEDEAVRALLAGEPLYKNIHDKLKDEKYNELDIEKGDTIKPASRLSGIVDSVVEIDDDIYTIHYTSIDLKKEHITYCKGEWIQGEHRFPSFDHVTFCKPFKPWKRK